MYYYSAVSFDHWSTRILVTVPQQKYYRLLVCVGALDFSLASLMDNMVMVVLRLHVPCKVGTLF